MIVCAALTVVCLLLGLLGLLVSDTLETWGFGLGVIGAVVTVIWFGLSRLPDGPIPEMDAGQSRFQAWLQAEDAFPARCRHYFNAMNEE